jgi:hypothetical protein
VSSSYTNGVLLTSSTNTVPPPSVEWMERSTTAGPWPAKVGVSYSESSGRQVKLFTGGEASRQSQGLFDLSAVLIIESELDPLTWSWIDSDKGFEPFLEPADPPVAVPPQQISLGALGNEGSDGNLSTGLASGIETVITPKAPVTSFTGPQPLAGGYTLITQTVSPTPTNQ